MNNIENQSAPFSFSLFVLAKDKIISYSITQNEDMKYEKFVISQNYLNLK